MKTDAPQHQATSSPSRADGVLTHALRHVRQFVCNLHGHDMLLHFGARRVSLVCTTCGFESPGWTVPGAPVGSGGTPDGRSAIARRQVA